MAAKIFSAPKTIPAPVFNSVRDANGRFDFEGHRKAEEKYVEDVVTWAKANSKSKDPIVGEIYRVGMADGYAQYVVFETKPLSLIHLAVGDAYAVDAIHARGLNLTDIRNNVERSKKLEALFGGAA